MKRFCVIGFPISHSLSPRIHNRAFRALKISAQYEAVEVKPEKLAAFMKTFRDCFDGANVTIPHKETVMKFLDEVAPEARAIGAVNTIVKRGKKLIGYNTDVYGALEALNAGFTSKAGPRSRSKPPQVAHPFLRGKKVLILGAGGAARAIVYGLTKAGADVMILNRTLSRAKKLAREFRCAYPKNSDATSLKALLGTSNIIINTTSVGMMRHGKLSSDSPLPQLIACLQNSKKKPIVMDIIYRPRMTKFLRDAKRAGCPIITGDKMFLAQADKSFELWTGRKPGLMKL